MTLATAWIGLGLLAAATLPDRPKSAKTFGKPAAVLLYALASVVGLLTVGWGIGDSAAARDTLLGTRKAITETRALTKHPAQCLMTSDEGLALLQKAIRDPLAPCFVSVRYLAMAERERMLAARTIGNTKAADEARAAFFRDARQALAMMDRDPEILLFLAIESVEYEHYPATPERLAESRELLMQVLAYLPNSAQAHLLQAKQLAYEHQMDAAEQEARLALSLDPQYARAYLWLARIESIRLDRILLNQEPGRNPVALVTGKDLTGRHLATDTAAHYARAAALGHQLDDSDRMKYATVLFLTGQTAQGLTVGRPIKGHGRAAGVVGAGILLLHSQGPGGGGAAGGRGVAGKGGAECAHADDIAILASVVGWGRTVIGCYDRCPCVS